jgi:hypothetical protein
MRKHAIDFWVVPMREYNEDPIFSSITAPETFAARRRTIYVFFVKWRSRGDRAIARLRRADRAGRHVAGRRVRRTDVGEDRREPGERTSGGSSGATEQWLLLKEVVEERKPKADRHRTARRRSRSADGLSSGELQGMSAALGKTCEREVP